MRTIVSMKFKNHEGKTATVSYLYGRPSWYRRYQHRLETSFCQPIVRHSKTEIVRDFGLLMEQLKRSYYEPSTVDGVVI